MLTQKIDTLLWLCYYLTDWLTIWLMPSDKRNSMTAKAMGLIYSLSNIALSRDVSFRQPLQFHCSHHGSTKAYLCSWLLSPLPLRWRFMVAPLHGFVEDLIIIKLITEVFNKLSFCLKHSVKRYTTLKTKRNRPFTFSPWQINPGGACVYAWSWVNFLYYHIAARRDTSCSSLYIALCNGANIHEYKAYWHMSFSLISGCGTRENSIRGHSFFWSGACEFANIIIVAKKSKQTSVRKN